MACLPLSGEEPSSDWISPSQKPLESLAAVEPSLPVPVAALPLMVAVTSLAVVVDQQILVVLVVVQRYGSRFGRPLRRGGLRRHRGAGTHDESGHKRCSADNGTDRFRHSSFMHDYPR